MVSAQSGFASLPELETDQRVLVHDRSWEEFEAFLAAKGDNPIPRMAYSRGTIELMSPSRRHEDRRALLGSFVLTFVLERGLYYGPWGATTLRSERLERAAEPDESFAFSKDAEKPDLVIETVLTSGGLDKLDIYAALEIREVWFWFETGLEAYVLVDGAYVRSEESQVLPGLSIDLVDRHARIDDANDALQAFRAALQV